MDFDGFWAGRVPDVMAWARPGLWLDSVGRGGFVNSGVRGRLLGVRGFVDPLGEFVGLWMGSRLRGFVN